jgi:predicted transposase/invertase (TIGR01784 family)
MTERLEAIGLTDYYFKELIKRKKNYLTLLLNGICNLDLKESDITLTDTEERDLCTLKTVNYDIKVVSMDLTIDLEAQIGINSKEKNEYGEYIYDVSRGFYYLSLLHSKSYEYKEKGYRKKRSKVIFIYKYDIEGDDWIQKIANMNFSTKRVYDDMELYLVSLEKIPEDSKMELGRALKLLSTKDIGKYLEDKSKIIKEAAEMLSDYDKTDEARRLRDARLKQEYEEGVRLEAAKDEGIAEGIVQGREEGIAQGREEGIAQGREEGIALGEEKNKKEFISIMIQNGMKKEEIARLLNLSMEDVEKYTK